MKMNRMENYLTAIEFIQLLFGFCSLFMHHAYTIYIIQLGSTYPDIFRRYLNGLIIHFVFVFGAKNKILVRLMFDQFNFEH